MSTYLHRYVSRLYVHNTSVVSLFSLKLFVNCIGTWYITDDNQKIRFKNMDIKRALVDGLQSNPKYIPVWFRYDKQGSLFNDRCLSDNKFYYFYRSELNVISESVQVNCFVDLVLHLIDANC